MLWTLLTYLFDNYGKVSANDVDNNNKKICQPWDPNTPFKTIMNQIDTAKDYTKVGGQAYTNKQI